MQSLHNPSNCHPAYSFFRVYAVRSLVYSKHKYLLNCRFGK